MLSYISNNRVLLVPDLPNHHKINLYFPKYAKFDHQAAKTQQKTILVLRSIVELR